MEQTVHADHPDPKQIERVLRGEASRAENRALVRHLLLGCPRCQAVARRSWCENESALARLVFVALPKAIQKVFASRS